MFFFGATLNIRIHTSLVLRAHFFVPWAGGGSSVRVEHVIFQYDPCDLKRIFLQRKALDFCGRNENSFRGMKVATWLILPVVYACLKD